MQSYTLIDSKLFGLILDRLCFQLIENHNDFADTVILGIQPRGVFLAEALVHRLNKIQPEFIVQHGMLDPTFYRDDFREHQGPLVAHHTHIPFPIENKHVVLVDDVLYTGRTIRSAIEGILQYGRPESVDLLVFIDRKFSREVPIQPGYVGMSIDSYDHQTVRLFWKKGGAENEHTVVLSEP